jgi:hypothetical protein
LILSLRKAVCYSYTSVAFDRLKVVRHAGAAPAFSVWKTDVFAVTLMTL